jgi:hypothetical protein
MTGAWLTLNATVGAFPGVINTVLGVESSGVNTGILIDARNAAARTAHMVDAQLDHVRPSFDPLPTAPDEPKKFSQDRVKDCDLCVLLVAFPRGHVPEGEELSITQLEYEAAARSGVDILVFMLDENSPWPRKFDELAKDSGIRLFRAKLGECKGVSFFDLDPSSIEIVPAVTRWIAERRESLGSASSPLPPSPSAFCPER